MCCEIEKYVRDTDIWMPGCIAVRMIARTWNGPVIAADSANMVNVIIPLI